MSCALLPSVLSMDMEGPSSFRSDLYCKLVAISMFSCSLSLNMIPICRRFKNFICVETKETGLWHATIRKNLPFEGA